MEIDDQIADLNLTFNVSIFTVLLFSASVLVVPIWNSICAILVPVNTLPPAVLDLKDVQFLNAFFDWELIFKSVIRGGS